MMKLNKTQQLASASASMIIFFTILTATTLMGVVIAGAVLPSTAHAQNFDGDSKARTGDSRSGNNQHRGAPRQPPQFAIDVCSGRSEGDSCSMQTPHGEESGICHTTPDKQYFACKPDRPPRKR